MFLFVPVSVVGQNGTDEESASDQVVVEAHETGSSRPTERDIKKESAAIEGFSGGGGSANQNGAL